MQILLLVPGAITPSYATGRQNRLYFLGNTNQFLYEYFYST